MLERIGVRLVTVDRPGYGQSDPKPGSSVLGVAADLRQLVTDRELSPVTAVGISAGGPYALGLAAHAPDDIRRVGLLSSLGPVSSVASRRGMNRMNRATFMMAQLLPQAVVHHLVGRVTHHWSRDPRAAFDRLASQFAQSDQSVLADMRDHGAHDLAEAIAQGGSGLSGDLTRLVRDWGFTPAEVGCPVDIWHGSEDCNVPVSHARSLADQLPDARLNVMAGEGHLMFDPRLEAILASLIEALPGEGATGA